ncbi:diacylglycerol/lipid kinase family protein [Actinophytocola sp.]|uniref:diacylglycerol/lipid kinase family protein n=1 Tax=Actinophytocola sp. TaxID=1872138 RepID=UPI003D6B4EA2
MTDRSRVTAIVNPAAGGDGDRAVAALTAADTAEVDVVRTTASGVAADIAYKFAAGDARPDLVVAVGGDGTVGEVATGLYRAVESGVVGVPPLLVAPAGTGNSCYRGMWDDIPFEDVLRVALRGGAAVRSLDLARIEENEHIMLLGSGSGLFAASLVATRSRTETGRELLMAAALAAMETYEPYSGRVVVDGEVLYEGGVVETIVGGFRYRGGLLNLVPESVLDDGLLDVTLVTTAADMTQFARAAMHGCVYDVPGIRWGRGVRITIERTDGEPILFEHDGEVMPRATSAYTSSVLPAALRVLTLPEPQPWFQGRGPC